MLRKAWESGSRTEQAGGKLFAPERKPDFRNFPRNLSRLIAACLAVIAIILLITPAQAQLICDGDAAGESGGGATATGSAPNTACGFFANASGTLSANTALGYDANASGNSSNNTATGAGASASEQQMMEMPR